MANESGQARRLEQPQQQQQQPWGGKGKQWQPQQPAWRPSLWPAQQPQFQAPRGKGAGGLALPNPFWDQEAAAQGGPALQNPGGKPGKGKWQKGQQKGKFQGNKGGQLALGW